MRLRLTSRRGRLAAFFLLYLSEGIPFGFTAVTMTAYLRRHGVGLEAIGLFTASLYAPWGFKWAWAPLIDLVRFDRFGTSRAWIVFAQSMMIVTIGVVLFFDPALQLGLVTSLIIVHNVFAATQDVAIDALAVRVLPENELGTANGLMFSAAYLGQAVGGSGALFIAGKLGYDAAFVFMLVSLTVLLFAVSLPLLEPPIVAPALAAPPLAASGRMDGDSTRKSTRSAIYRQALDRLVFFLRELYTSFFRSGRGPIIGVVLAILPQGAVALGLALATTIPIDLGMSEERVAGLSFLSSIASALGCVAGGWVSDRVGHRRSLAIWYAMTAAPTLFLAWRFAAGPGGSPASRPASTRQSPSSSRSRAGFITAPATRCSWRSRARRWRPPSSPGTWRSRTWLCPTRATGRERWRASMATHARCSSTG